MYNSILCTLCLIFTFSVLHGCGDDTSSESSDTMNMMAQGGMNMPANTNMGGSMTDTMNMGGAMTGQPMTVSTETVQAIFDGSCTGCHNDQSVQGQLSLQNFESQTVGVESTVSGLVLITAGDHQASYLWHKVNGTHLDVGGNGSQMPFGPSLSAGDIAAIADYIDALEN